MKTLFLIYSFTGLIRQQALVTVFGYKSSCKHSPTCSVFTRQKIEEYGALKGLWLGFRRIISCW